MAAYIDAQKGQIKKKWCESYCMMNEDDWTKGDRMNVSLIEKRKRVQLQIKEGARNLFEQTERKRRF